MNKLILILAALMFTLALAGCGSAEEEAPASINGQAPNPDADPTNTEAGGTNTITPQ